MQELFELFKEIGFGSLYYRQGSLSDENYPPEFYTYWNIDSPYLQRRDNKEKSFIEYIQVGFYTTDPIAAYTKMDEFIKKAKQKGFRIEGKPKDANAGRADYFGRVCTIRYIRKI